MFKRLFIMLLSLVFSAQCFAEPSSYHYVVKIDESATMILHRARFLPLYTQSGSLAQLAQFNKGHVKNINRLQFGEKIYFTPEQVKEALEKKLITISVDNEIQFTELSFQTQKEKINKNSKIVKNENILQPVREEIKEQVRSVATEAPAEKPVEPTGHVEDVKPQVENIKNPKTADDETFSEVAFLLGTGYSALSGYDSTNNTKAQILSRLNSQFQLNWIQNWNESAKTSFMVGYKSSHFEPDYKSTQVYNSTIDAYRFGFDYEDKLTTTLKYNFGIEESQLLFYRGLSVGSSTGLEVNAVPLTQFIFGMRKSLLRKGRYELGANLSLKYILGGEYQNYTIQNGNEYVLRIYLDETFKKRNINCGILYKRRNQNTSLINFSETGLDFTCLYKWNY